MIRSVRERARARPRSAQNVENPPLEVAPTQTTVGSTRRSAAVCGGLGSRVKKEPKKAYRDFQAIRRKGVVQGQSRQALMSWRDSPFYRHIGTGNLPFGTLLVIPIRLQMEAGIGHITMKREVSEGLARGTKIYGYQYSATWSSSGLRLRSKNSACPLSGAILDIPCDMFPARQHLAAGKIRFWDPTLYYNYPLFTSKVDTPFGSTTDLVVLLTTASTHVTSDEVGVAPDLGAAEGACAAIVHLC